VKFESVPEKENSRERQFHHLKLLSARPFDCEVNEHGGSRERGRVRRLTVCDLVSQVQNSDRRGLPVSLGSPTWHLCSTSRSWGDMP
jgi:hypothetical protein